MEPLGLEEELSFLGNSYWEEPLPPDKWFLLKYFNTDIQSKFVRYYYKFRSIDKFVDHTGIYCGDRWLQMMRRKFEEYENSMRLAKSRIDLESISRIENGKHIGRHRKCGK